MNCINEQTDMYKAKLSKHAQVLAEICAFALRFLLNILNREAENRLDNHSINILTATLIIRQTGRLR